MSRISGECRTLLIILQEAENRLKTVEKGIILDILQSSEYTSDNNNFNGSQIFILTHLDDHTVYFSKQIFQEHSLFTNEHSQKLIDILRNQKMYQGFL